MSIHTGSPYEGLTKANFDALKWPSLIAPVASKECDQYGKVFADRAKTLEETQQLEMARAARVLVDIALFGFQPNESDRAFHPMMTFGNQRTPLPEDFPKDLINIIAALASEADDAEFGARLGDVAFSCMPKKDAKLIEATIENYLVSGAQLFRQSRWDAGYLRFRRAVHLARKPSPALFAMVKAAFDTFLNETAISAPLPEVVQILELYREYVPGDAAILVKHAAYYATKAAEAKAWHLCRRLQMMCAQWLAAEGKETEASAALYEAAEAYVKLAEEAMRRPTPSPLAAADHLLRAARAHRDIDKASVRAAELDRMRAAYQKQGIERMQWVNLAEQPDAGALRQAIQNAENALRTAALDAARAARGLPFYDALRLLALCHPPPDKARTEAMAIEGLQTGVFSSLIPLTLYDEEGRPFVKAGSFLHENPKGQRLIIQQRMLEWFKTYHVPETVAIFEAIREQVNDEHNIRPEYLEPVVSHSPFIPPGRGYFFARGLYAGLIGDFPLAGNLLAPQLENAIKVTLQLAGIIPTVTEASDTERPADLNFLFNSKHKEIEAVFGVDETFEMEALLIRRWGCHLRNYTAHGQLSPREFFEPPVRYLWWLTLRFCMFGAAPLPKPKAQE